VFKILSQRSRKLSGIKLVLIRLASVETWAASQGRGESLYGYRDFLKRHRNRFKHAYVKEDIKITYDEAVERIGRLTGSYKDAAMTILSNGIRISEILTIQDGWVTGKGGKRRQLYGKIYIGKSVPSVSHLSAKLRAVGLKPHTLRKLCATRMANKGATAADLCQVFGWSKLDTAYHYLQARGDDKLRELVSGQEVHLR
jgi:integrase